MAPATEPSKQTNQVDDTARDIGLDIASQRGRTIRNRGEVAGSHVQVVIILEEERPGARVESRRRGLGFDRVLVLDVHLIRHFEDL